MADHPFISRLAPSAELAADEALLRAPPGPGDATVRLYVVSGRAVVVGFAQRLRQPGLLDEQRIAAEEVEVIQRRAGGGLVLLDDGMLCLTVALGLPHPVVGNDLTESYRWLGDALAESLRALGFADARRAEVPEARASKHLVSASPELAGLVAATCYGGLSPHEVLVDERKAVGLAQVRKRDVALYQVGILLRNQSALANLMRVEAEPIRGELRELLARRTVGLSELGRGEVNVNRLAATIMTWGALSTHDRLHERGGPWP